MLIWHVMLKINDWVQTLGQIFKGRFPYFWLQTSWTQTEIALVVVVVVSYILHHKPTSRMRWPRYTELFWSRDVGVPRSTSGSYDEELRSQFFHFVALICALHDMLTALHTHTTHNRFTALWNLSGKTRVSRYQKKHSPTTLIIVINHP